jgi:hypothetical protein
MTEAAIATAAAVGVVEIINAIAKHESKLRKLIKKLKSCCCSRPSPPHTPPTETTTAFESTEADEGTEIPIDI